MSRVRFFLECLLLLALAIVCGLLSIVAGFFVALWCGVADALHGRPQDRA